MPQILEWSNAFKTGNRGIDIDHQSLFVLDNDLADQVQQDARSSGRQASIHLEATMR